MSTLLTIRVTLLLRKVLRQILILPPEKEQRNTALVLVFTAGYLRDFTDDEDHDTRVSSLYFDIADSGRKYFLRAGRQSRSSGGVLGRFDGGLFSYQLNKKLKANIVAGSPVNRTKDGLETSRVFYGASFDIGTLAKAWDFTAFAIEQTNSSLIDRRAVGGEARYFDPKKIII